MNAHDKDVRTASLFRNGRSQAVRIPKEFEFEGDEVEIRKEADGSIKLIPKRRERSPKEIVEWLRGQPQLTEEDFPDISDDDMLPLDDIQL
jgi:antitoxin VapB